MSSVKKPAKRKKEVAHVEVEDLGPAKDAKGGAQKKEEVTTSPPLVLQH